MTTTAPDLRERAPEGQCYVDHKGGVRCQRCRRAMFRVDFDAENRPPIIMGHKCQFCRSYNLVDAERVPIM